MEKPTEELVFDRTQQDVDRMASMLKLTYASLTDEQKAEWDSHKSKGSWNYTDANRVAAYVNYLIDWLNSVGYYIKNSEKIFELWSMISVFSTEDAKNMYSALDLVAKSIYSDISTPVYTSALTYTKANEIESLLHKLVDYTERYLLSRFYCAEPYCGEV